MMRNWQSPRGSQLPVCPSTAHNRDLGRTALLRLAVNPSSGFVNSARLKVAGLADGLTWSGIAGVGILAGWDLLSHCLSLTFHSGMPI